MWWLEPVDVFSTWASRFRRSREHQAKRRYNRSQYASPRSGSGCRQFLLSAMGGKWTFASVRVELDLNMLPGTFCCLFGSGDARPTGLAIGVNNYLLVVRRCQGRLKRSHVGERWSFRNSCFAGNARSIPHNDSKRL